MLDQATKEELARRLFDIGAVKFGDFTFKSGIKSPMYVDHRVLVSYPKTLMFVAEIYAKMLEDIEYDRLAGIPYGAMPIAGAVSLLVDKPWIYPRKEVKDYGTKSPIEGKYYEGEIVVVLDDMVTNGDSKLEAVAPLTKAGLIVRDFVVLEDYLKGASEKLASKGYRLTRALTMAELVDLVHLQNLINDEMHQRASDFLAKSD